MPSSRAKRAGRGKKRDPFAGYPVLDPTGKGKMEVRVESYPPTSKLAGPQPRKKKKKK
jgi:hypothetical protein